MLNYHSSKVLLSRCPFFSGICGYGRLVLVWYILVGLDWRAIENLALAETPKRSCSSTLGTFAGSLKVAGAWPDEPSGVALQKPNIEPDKGAFQEASSLQRAPLQVPREFFRSVAVDQFGCVPSLGFPLKDVV